MTERAQAVEAGNDLYFLESAGVSSEIGLKYGEAFRSQLGEAVGRTNAALAGRYEAAQVEQAAKLMGESFSRTFPYLWDELEAIGAGGGILPADLQRHVFSAGIGKFPEDDGCTDVIFPRSEKGPLLGKTHDATSPGPGTAVVRLIRHTSMGTVLCVTRIDGLSTMTGMNEKGLAIGEASIHFHSVNKTGTIRNLLLRPVLHECSDVYEAVEFLAAHPPLSAGFHFAMVDASGNAAIVERSPTDQNVRWSKGEAIFCTNHAATPSVRALEKSRGPEGDRNSDARYENLKKLTGGTGFEFTLDSMKEILRFHGATGGICQHGDPEYKREQQLFYPLFTQRAFINIVKSGMLLVANGNPCHTDYLEFFLNARRGPFK